MNTNSALYALGCDLLVGTLLLRYWFVARTLGRKVRIPISWWLIIGLVNVSALFTGPIVEKAVAALGGACLALLLLSAIEEEGKKLPNPSSQPTPPKGG